MGKGSTKKVTKNDHGAESVAKNFVSAHFSPIQFSLIYYEVLIILH